MANEQIKALLIQISASTELLRSNVTQAQQVMSRFDREVEQSGQRVTTAFNKIGVSAGQQRAGLQQLGYQLSDISTMYALGARPMQIFASQSGQVLQAVQLMTGGTSKLASFLGGPWGIAIVAATTFLTPFIAKLFDTGDAANAAAKALDNLSKRRAAFEAKQTELTDALAKYRDYAQQASDKEAEIAMRSGGRLQADGTPMFAHRQYLQLQELRRKMKEASKDIQFGIFERTGSLEDFLAPDKIDRTSRGGGGRAGSGGGGSKSGKAEPSWSDRAFAMFAEEGLPGLNVAVGKVGERLIDVYNDGYNQLMEQVGKEGDLRAEMFQRVYAERMRIEQRQVQFLAGLWEDAFRGGTKAIWRDFKNIGLAVISQLAARFVAAQAGLFRDNQGNKIGFDFGSALGASLFSVFGFADGGRPPVGRVSVVGERGPELFVPDVAGTVVPNGGFGGGTVINIYAQGATAETVALIRREIWNAVPAITQASSAATMRRLGRRQL